MNEADKQFESILTRMLSRVPDGLDKREGSVIYYALAPAAAELTQAYIELETLYNETFADTASREGLIKRCAERGIVPEAATKTIAKGKFNIDVAISSKYTSGNFVFTVLEKLSEGVYTLQADDYGATTNAASGPIIPTVYTEGLTSAEILEILIPGEDEESTESLRARYFESFTVQPFGGNRADYKAKTNTIKGVGGTKAVRTPAGAGTVGVTIISSDYGVPSSELIALVQNELDPIEASGDGLGIAPVGHSVTVSGVKDKLINIAFRLTYAPNWNWEALQPFVITMVDTYFLELRKTWQNENGLIVRRSQIESRLLEIPGVVDVADVTLNGAAQNIALAVDEIPKRGTVNG